MLESLHIQNFRLFRNFRIDDLARVNLIVGKNNVGKSSLLEALHLLINQKNPEAALDFLAARDNFAARAKSPAIADHEITDLFYNHQLTENASIEITSKGAQQLSLMIAKANGSLNLMYDWGGRDELAMPLKLINNRIQSVDLKQHPNAPTKSYYITTKGFDYHFLSRLWDQIVLSPKEHEVIRTLKIVEPQVERINFPSSYTSTSGIRVKLTAKDQPIPLTSMGDGVHRVLTLAMILVDSQNEYVLIDEIDTGLHYRVMTDMWRVVLETAVRLNVQVFATTHSWDCVESFAEALKMQVDDSVGALFRLEKREDDIAAVKYTAHELSVATRQSIEVR